MSTVTPANRLQIIEYSTFVKLVNPNNHFLQSQMYSSLTQWKRLNVFTDNVITLLMGSNWPKSQITLYEVFGFNANSIGLTLLLYIVVLNCLQCSCTVGSAYCDHD